MFVSKHHYAVELAKAGNEVYYINGPDQENKLKPGEIIITPTEITGLYLLEHRLFYPYIIKFKAQSLHHYLMRIHINNILKKINKKEGIVWSFDISNTIPLKCFPQSFTKIFMPVDEPLQPIAIKSAKGAQIMFSVTEEILNKYAEYPIPKHFINHGVAEFFFSSDGVSVQNNPIHIGLSGNMLRPEIDHETLLKIIEGNPNIIFDMWGTVNPSNSNLVALKYANKNSLNFVNKLSSLKNVNLHGQLKPEKLAKELQTVDGFLICYDIQKDQSRGTNYHKVLEYLATGKVVVSNNISTYTKIPGLIEMVESRINNEELPRLFSNVISNISCYNSLEKQQQRINFAKNMTYKNQIEKINFFINKMSVAG